MFCVIVVNAQTNCINVRLIHFKANYFLMTEAVVVKMSCICLNYVTLLLKYSLFLQWQIIFGLGKMECKWNKIREKIWFKYFYICSTSEAIWTQRHDVKMTWCWSYEHKRTKQLKISSTRSDFCYHFYSYFQIK